MPTLDTFVIVEEGAANDAGGMQLIGPRLEFISESSTSSATSSRADIPRPVGPVVYVGTNAVDCPDDLGPSASNDPEVGDSNGRALRCQSRSELVNEADVDALEDDDERAALVVSALDER